jgi:hypothetical protein
MASLAFVISHASVTQRLLQIAPCPVLSITPERDS